MYLWTDIYCTACSDDGCDGGAATASRPAPRSRGAQLRRHAPCRSGCGGRHLRRYLHENRWSVCAFNKCFSIAILCVCPLWSFMLTKLVMFILPYNKICIVCTYLWVLFRAFLLGTHTHFFTNFLILFLLYLIGVCVCNIQEQERTLG